MFLKKLLSSLFYLKNKEGEKRGQELILITILTSSIICFFVLSIIRFINIIKEPNSWGLPLVYTLNALIFFIFLFFLLRYGFLKYVSYSLVLTYLGLTIYSFLTWGTDLPCALLLAILTIILSGILLGTNLVLISTIFIIVFILTTSFLQKTHVISLASYWNKETNEFCSAVTHSIIILIIAIIAWLFCREIKKSLKRAQMSEAELIKEKDSLEIRVRERTAQLKLMEIEKISQLYRLAEFGRLSSGIFHDLINPLTAVSLNLEQIRITGEQKLFSAKSYLSQAIVATHRMAGLIVSIKKQLQREGSLCIFSVNEEIEQIIQILSYKIRQAKVAINFPEAIEYNLYGDPIKFGQIIGNLLANALEACENINYSSRQENIIVAIIFISVRKNGHNLNIMISDPGVGIADENINKIFEPFFSTKAKQGRGLGIGLSSTKNIIEQDFKGQIEVESKVNKGTKFIINLPLDKVPFSNQANE